MQAECSERPLVKRQQTSETLVEPKHSQDGKQNELFVLPKNHDEDKNVAMHRLKTDGQRDLAQNQLNVSDIKLNKWQILHWSLIYCVSKLFRELKANIWETCCGKKE